MDNFLSIAYAYLKRSEVDLNLCSKVELPSLIFQEDDFDFFHLPACSGNYIGADSVLSKCMAIDSDTISNEELSGKIILIESADPGFDWIFGANIGGLITKFGGANSHMAIRCAEFGIPAAIGVGEGVFISLSGANLIELNCINETIRVVG